MEAMEILESSTGGFDLERDSTEFGIGPSISPLPIFLRGGLFYLVEPAREINRMIPQSIEEAFFVLETEGP